jgi:hypothetical protein
MTAQKKVFLCADFALQNMVETTLPPFYGIGATIRIGREMLCLPYAGFFLLTPSLHSFSQSIATLQTSWSSPPTSLERT